METVQGILGYFFLLGFAWLCGRRSVTLPWKTLAIASVAQLVLAGILIQPSLSQPIFRIAHLLALLLQKTSLKASESLLFGSFSNDNFIGQFGPVIALQIISIIIFVSALSRVLYHYRILPWIIRLLSLGMQRLLGISSAESIGVAGNVFLGMTEAPLLIRPYVSRLTESELFCIMTAGMATIAGTVMIIYASMLSSIHPDIAGHLFVASLMSAPAAIVISKLMIPELERPETTGSDIRLPKQDTLNGLDAVARGASEGATLVINVLAMLIAFIGLIALINHGISWLDLLVNGNRSGWNLETWCGQAMRPLVWMMGIPWEKTNTVGQLMGLKTILNEFVAYSQLANLMQSPQALDHRSFIISSYALSGFANFGSIAIMIGGIGGISPERRGDLSRLGLRSLIGGTVATMLTGTVIGLYL